MTHDDVGGRAPNLEARVTAHDEGSRVDAFIARAMPEISRRQAKALARDGKIRIAGRPVVASTPVRVGDIVQLRLPEPTPAPQTASVRVLHRDDAFLYLHKPAGMHTVRLRPSDPPTLADAARELDPACASASPDPREGGALHRLDLGTSGVVAFARTAQAWARGRSALTGGAWKLYLAHAQGVADAWPPPATEHVRVIEDLPRWPEHALAARPSGPGASVTWPLAARGPRGQHITVDDAGQPALSRIWPLPSDASVFAIELVTGRRHQARVHMATLGLPLRGDPVYGTRPPSEPLRLHAWALRLGVDAPLVCAEPPPWCAL